MQLLNRLLLGAVLVCGFSIGYADYQSATIATALHKSGALPANVSLTTIQGASVRMAIFTTYNSYQPGSTELGASIWATVEPDLKTLCHAYAKQNKKQALSINTWIAELLGLPAENADKRRFVVLDVPVIQAYYGAPASSIGIFRPCTDPRIGPHQDGSPICPKQMNAADPYISPDYKTWFINNSIAAHSLENGAPWTEYGYTYNWNVAASSVYGVAEFVILKGTLVRVLANPGDRGTAYMTAEQYCG